MDSLPNHSENTALCDASGTPTSLCLRDVVGEAQEAVYDQGGIVGSGGFGVVYVMKRRPEGPQDGPANVALKVVRDLGDTHGEAVELRRAVNRILRNAAHENVVKMYGFVDLEGSDIVRPGIAYPMEFVDGEMLHTLIKKGMYHTESMECIKQVARGLAFLHGRGLAHTDLSSKNVLLTDPKNNKIFCRSVIIDTDGAALLDPSGNLIGTVPATLGYEAPELKDHHETISGAKLDTFAFGCMILAMRGLGERFDSNVRSYHLQELDSNRFPVFCPYFRDLLTKCFSHAITRPTMNSLLQHPLLADTRSSESFFDTIRREPNAFSSLYKCDVCSKLMKSTYQDCSLCSNNEEDRISDSQTNSALVQEDVTCLTDVCDTEGEYYAEYDESVPVSTASVTEAINVSYHHRHNENDLNPDKAHADDLLFTHQWRAARFVLRRNCNHFHNRFRSLRDRIHTLDLILYKGHLLQNYLKNPLYGSQVSIEYRDAEGKVPDHLDFSEWTNMTQLLVHDAPVNFRSPSLMKFEWDGRRKHRFRELRFAKSFAPNLFIFEIYRAAGVVWVHETMAKCFPGLSTLRIASCVGGINIRSDSLRELGLKNVEFTFPLQFARLHLPNLVKLYLRECKGFRPGLPHSIHVPRLRIFHIFKSSGVALTHIIFSAIEPNAFIMSVGQEIWEGGMFVSKMLIDQWFVTQDPLRTNCVVTTIQSLQDNCERWLATSCTVWPELKEKRNIFSIKNDDIALNADEWDVCLWRITEDQPNPSIFSPSLPRDSPDLPVRFRHPLSEPSNVAIPFLERLSLTGDLLQNRGRPIAVDLSVLKILKISHCHGVRLTGDSWKSLQTLQHLALSNCTDVVISQAFFKHIRGNLRSISSYPLHTASRCHRAGKEWQIYPGNYLRSHVADLADELERVLDLPVTLLEEHQWKGQYIEKLLHLRECELPEVRALRENEEPSYFTIYEDEVCEDWIRIPELPVDVHFDETETEPSIDDF